MISLYGGVSLLLYFTVISAGSVLASIVWKKKFEELVSISCISIICFLFICGMLGGLLQGFYCLLFIVGLIYIFCIYWFIKSEDKKSIIKNIITPVSIIYFCSVCATIYFTKDTLTMYIDELSYWADVVKAMVYVNDFATNPAAHCQFASYPPGMGLLQYFHERLFILVTGRDFSEWRLHLTYQTFCTALFIPYLKKIRWRDILLVIGAFMIVFLFPSVFLDYYHSSIFIDPFLAMLAGSGIVGVFLEKDYDALYILRTALTCAGLVLAKDAGLFFAAILAVVFLFDYYAIRKKSKRPYVGIIGVLAVTVPKLLWKTHLSMRNVHLVWQEPVHIKQIIKVMLGRDTTYRQKVWHDFWQALYKNTFPLGNTGISLHYVSAYILLLIGIYILSRIYLRRGANKNKVRLLNITCIALTIVYVYGLCTVTYISNFTEYLASELSAISRYVALSLILLCTVIVIMMLTLVSESGAGNAVRHRNLIVICTIAFLLTICPMESVYWYVSRDAVEYSRGLRRVNYIPILTKINTLTEEESKIFLIDQETTGTFDYNYLRYYSRPREFASDNDTGGGIWSIGEPFFDGDIYTYTMDVDDWITYMDERNYNYVALYRLNDYFYQHFSDAFENPSAIGDDRLFKYDSGIKKLILVE